MKQPSYRLRIPDSLVELLRGMHPHLKRKIKASLQLILSNPNEGKALKNDLEGLRSFRVSRFRIIYRIGKNIIEIIAVGPRERVYEETLHILRKEARR